MTDETAPPELIRTLIQFLGKELDTPPHEVQGARRGPDYELQLFFEEERIAFLSYPGPLPHGLPERFRWKPTEADMQAIRDVRREERQSSSAAGMLMILAAAFAAAWLMSRMPSSGSGALAGLNDEQSARILKWSETRSETWRPIWDPARAEVEWLKATRAGCPLSTGERTAEPGQGEPIAARWLLLEEVPSAKDCRGPTDILTRTDLINVLSADPPGGFTDAQARSALNRVLAQREQHGLLEIQEPGNAASLSRPWSEARSALKSSGLYIPPITGR